MPRRSAASMAGSIPRGFRGVEAVIDEIEAEWSRTKRAGGERILDFEWTWEGRFVTRHAVAFWNAVRELGQPAPAALSLASRLYAVFVESDLAVQRLIYQRTGYVRPENPPTLAQRRLLAGAILHAAMRQRLNPGP